MQAPNKPQLSFYFINGRGSTGKDTQAERMQRRVPDSIRISTGDIYRGAKNQEGEFARYHSQIAPYAPHVDNGGLIPDAVMLPIVEEVIQEKAITGIRNFIFTGFPRTIPQLDATDEMISNLARDFMVEAKFIVVAGLPSHSRERAKIRREAAERKHKKPRDDDDPIKVENRLKTYKELIEPMLHKLTQEGRLIIVRADGNIMETSRRFREQVLEQPAVKRERE